MSDIFVLDHLKPEANAMLQALYSRSPASVVDHLQKVEEKGADNFMASYYVGYGHKSIGDCGTTTIFIENVSLLAAKAIQDWPLYNGQEASTRYLDMAKQGCVDPTFTEEGNELLKFCMDFYANLMPKLVVSLTEQYPIKEAEDQKVYMRSIKARAFDIARGFLPAGVMTNLSWHTNLRQASDHLKQLRHHPLQEVRELARDIVDLLKEKYPSSFQHKQHHEEEAFLHLCGLEYYVYYGGSDIYRQFVATDYLEAEELEVYSKILAARPAKAELPHGARMCGDVEFRFCLDFGSYRDLQRHRGVVQEMPLHSEGLGFHQWYLDQLSVELREEAQAFLAEFERKLLELRLLHKTSCEEEQYFIPLGYEMYVVVLAPLPAAVYLAELRSSQHVHPTLRKVAQQMGEWLKDNVPDLAMHHDMSPDAWSIQRGHQTIEEKK